MNRHGARAVAVCLTALAFMLTIARPAQADLLVQQGIDELSGYRTALEGETVQMMRALEASLVLFFPPLSPPPQEPQSNFDGPPEPPLPPIDPPEEPPNHLPEPASLVAGALGSSLMCFFGWWRRRE